MHLTGAFTASDRDTIGVAGFCDAQDGSFFILPSINEEYGYEGHYPPWGCGATAAKEKPDGRSGINRSQLAWEICMTGSYQTTGETAEFDMGAGDGHRRRMDQR